MKPNAFSWPWIGAFTALSVMSSEPALAAEIAGRVLGGGAPIARSTVNLWLAGSDAPRQLGQAQTGDDSRFTLSYQGPSPEGISYLVAAQGRGQPGDCDANGAGQ